MQISFKNLSCCVCDREYSKSHFFKKIDGYELRRCTGCGLVYLANIEVNPENFLSEVVSDGAKGKLEYWGYPEYFAKHFEVFSFFFEERYQRIKKHLKIEGPWLDVGSGYGFWQAFLNEKKEKNLGLEIEGEAFRYAKKQHIEIQHVSIEKFETDMKFSVITICDVLEHVESPLEILKKCYNLLLPGGVVYIQVPNVLGFKYPYGDSFGLPHHLWQFDYSTLSSLTERSGFEMIDYWTGIQGVIKHYENGGPSLLKKMLWSIARNTKRGNRLQLLVKK